jgi:hypothetical protein
MPVAVSEKKLTKQTFQAVLYIASNFTLCDALDLLDLLNETYGKKLIHTEDIRQIRFIELGYDPFNLLKPCSRIGPIWFRGGPMGNYMQGMACQFVADCILQHIRIRGPYTFETALANVLRQGAP